MKIPQPSLAFSIALKLKAVVLIGTVGGNGSSSSTMTSFSPRNSTVTTIQLLDPLSLSHIHQSSFLGHGHDHTAKSFPQDADVVTWRSNVTALDAAD